LTISLPVGESVYYLSDNPLSAETHPDKS